MKKLLILSAFTAVMLSACKPDNDFSIGTPQNRMAQLAGNWKLQSATQTDLKAKSYNYNDPSRPDVSLITQDITAAYPFNTITLSFAEDAANAPTTFTANYGAAPKIFKLTTGTWKVDNLATPGAIRLINGTDTTKTTLGSVNTLSAGLLNIQLTKYDVSNKPAIQYNYIFKKN